MSLPIVVRTAIRCLVTTALLSAMALAADASLPVNLLSADLTQHKAKAIDRGLAYLANAQTDDGAWPGNGRHRHRGHGLHGPWQPAKRRALPRRHDQGHRLDPAPAARGRCTGAAGMRRSTSTR